MNFWGMGGANEFNFEDTESEVTAGSSSGEPSKHILRVWNHESITRFLVNLILPLLIISIQVSKVTWPKSYSKLVV